MSNVTTSLKYAGQELTQLVNTGASHDSVVVRRKVDRRPQRRVTKILIPGRNGAQYVDNDEFENVPISYTMVFPNDYVNCDALVNFLMAQNGYNRLEDQYDPDTYRMARVSGALDPVSPDDEKGYLVINFECLPERWLKPSAEYPETITIMDNAVHDIQNPTRYNAKPLIRVYGDNAEVKIRRKLDGASVYLYSFTVTDGIYPTVNSSVVDSDKEDVYANDINYNSYVTFNGDSHEFPLLEGIKTSSSGSGVTQVQVGSGDITKIEITPRWWKL